MTDEIIIKSSRSDYELKLSEPKPHGMKAPVEYIRVSIKGHDLTASTSKVYIYEPKHLTGFFADLAANWKGWKGEKAWNSIEEDFAITATSDRLGHIALKVTLKSGPYGDDWAIEACIYVEAGQMEEIAKRVKKYLHSL